ncbi:pyridoxal phosphate-dependent aminotransferase [Aerococcaceae bacterium WGS1372]
MIIMDRNTSPISPIKDEYYAKLADLTDYSGYPDDEPVYLKELYAKQNNLDVNQIELANGADEWIQKSFITLGKEGVMTVTPDFFMYHDYAMQLGLPYYEVSSNADFTFDFDKIVQEIKDKRPSLFIISNPHNPTGVMFEASDLQKIADAMGAIGGYFVIDEAYIEFGRNYQRPQGDHILIIRTMSKIYGMAGFRVGIIIAQNDTFDKVTKINHPYPLSHVAMNFARILLEDTEWVNEFKEYQLEAQGKLINAFDPVKEFMNVNESHTNFVFTYGEKALSLGEFLKDNGFLARFYQENNLKNTVRYSIIKLEDYDRFNELIEQWILMQ